MGSRGAFLTALEVLDTTAAASFGQFNEEMVNVTGFQVSTCAPFARESVFENILSHGLCCVSYRSKQNATTNPTCSGKTIKVTFTGGLVVIARW